MKTKRLKTSTIFDIGLTVILAIAIIIGICYAVVKSREKRITGEITLENYDKFIGVSCELSDGTITDEGLTYKYKLIADTQFDCFIDNFEIVVEVISEHSDFGTYTLESYELTPSRSSCNVTGTVHYTFPDYYEGSSNPSFTFNVISVKGTYSYISKG